MTVRGSQNAAVLIPVFRRQDAEIRLALVRRGPHGIHGGQIALPGGKPEAEDASMLDTALREAQEETGICRDQVTILSALPVVETQTTGFRIYPFLGRITPPETWRCAADEIESVLEVKVRDLIASQDEEVAHFPTWPEPRRIDLFRVAGEKVWGATYRILEPLLPRLLAGEWEV